MGKAPRPKLMVEMNWGSVIRCQLFSDSVPALRRTPFCCRRKLFKQLFYFLIFSDMLKLMHYHSPLSHEPQGCLAPPLVISQPSVCDGQLPAQGRRPCGGLSCPELKEPSEWGPPLGRRASGHNCAVPSTCLITKHMSELVEEVNKPNEDVKVYDPDTAQVAKGV